MVALYTQLEQSGVILSKKAGFLRWERRDGGDWQVTKASEARVLTMAPIDADTGEPVLEYDPEFTLLLAVENKDPEDLTLLILEVDENVTFFQVMGVGMVFKTEDQKFEISQDPNFWDDVYGYMAALGQPKPKGGTHV